MAIADVRILASEDSPTITNAKYANPNDDQSLLTIFPAKISDKNVLISFKMILLDRMMSILSIYDV